MTLNILAGFMDASAGEVFIDDREVTRLEPHKRGLGMVFQSHALFPHMTIFDNVGFGLKMRSVPPSEIASRVRDALDMVRLEGFEKRYPREMSGGQQQRVGLARALAVRPSVLLMDEPLSSLDAKLRREMQIELRSIQRETGIAVLYVTHDQEEALSMSDRVVVMNQGRVEQVGPPEEVYSQPASEFVAGFIGEASFLAAKVVGYGDGTLDAVLHEGDGRLTARSGGGAGTAQDIRLALRPDRVRLAPVSAGEAKIVGTLSGKSFLGPVMRCVVRLTSGAIVLADLPALESGRFDVGSGVALDVNPADWLVFAGNRA